MSEQLGQRRAKAGGEVGANGDWYEGGKFIATQEDTIKSAPPARYEPTAAELAERAERKIKQDAEVLRLNTWLAERAEKFKDVLFALEYPMTDQWDKPIKSTNEFMNSLANQLRTNGSLSPKQADCVVRAVIGRATKKNTSAWEAMFDDLITQYK